MCLTDSDVSAYEQNRAYMTSQIGDLVAKIGKTEATVRHRCGIGAMSAVITAARANSKRTNAEESAKEETPLAKAVKDS